MKSYRMRHEAQGFLYTLQPREIGADLESIPPNQSEKESNAKCNMLPLMEPGTEKKTLVQKPVKYEVWSLVIKN